MTDDDGLAKAAYRLKNYGRDRKGTFVHETIGFNFSFTDLQAAIGLAQMKKMPAIIRKKRAIHDRYANELTDVVDLRPVFVDSRCEPVFWFTSFLCSDPDALAEFLRAQNIQTRRFFYPLHLQPCYANCDIVKGLDGDFSISETIYRCGISLPSSFGLSAEDQSHVIQQIKRFYAHRH